MESATLHVPHWLDPANEWTAADEAALVKPAPGVAFVLACVDELLALPAGLDVAQACEVTANACEESGLGQHGVGNNIGGVKIQPHDQVVGVPLRWSKAPGHVAGGDAPWCFYKVYATRAAFFAEWVARYVPKTPGTRYEAAGKAFWSHAEPWFPHMVAAGYKGEVTRKHPEVLLHDEALLDLKVEHVVAQRALQAQGFYAGKVDGKWGPASADACLRFQQKACLGRVGELDALTLWCLAYGATRPVPAWARI